MKLEQTRSTSWFTAFLLIALLGYTFTMSVPNVVMAQGDDAVAADNAAPAGDDSSPERQNYLTWMLGALGIGGDNGPPRRGLAQGGYVQITK